jgi:NADH-quinone oxidoreductase subunit H
MISYELALGLSLVPIVMLADSLSIVEIVKAQEKYPFILVQPFAFVIFMISAMAESKRIPFDMPEAENELGAGYHTEYSGIRFGLFFLAGGGPFFGRLAGPHFAAPGMAFYQNHICGVDNDLG